MTLTPGKKYKIKNDPLSLYCVYIGVSTSGDFVFESTGRGSFFIRSGVAEFEECKEPRKMKICIYEDSEGLYIYNGDDRYKYNGAKKIDEIEWVEKT